MPGITDAKPSSLSSENGFTLLELLAALVLIGVASSIFFSLFTASATLALTNRSQGAGARLAGEYLTEILSSPESFNWPDFESQPYGSLLPLGRPGQGDESFVSAEPPSVQPTDPRADQRETAMYSGYSLEAFASVPNEDASYVEVVVNVWWNEVGREQLYSATSCVPRYVSERAAG